MKFAGCLVQHVFAENVTTIHKKRAVYFRRKENPASEAQHKFDHLPFAAKKKKLVKKQKRDGRRFDSQYTRRVG